MIGRLWIVWFGGKRGCGLFLCSKTISARRLDEILLALGPAFFVMFSSVFALEGGWTLAETDGVELIAAISASNKQVSTNQSLKKSYVVVLRIM